MDVDALWAQMATAPLKPTLEPLVPAVETSTRDEAAPKPIAQAVEEEEQVTVKKAYTFAGQRTEEEKQVPRSALEQYLSDGWKTVDPSKEPEPETTETPASKPEDEGPKIRRPLRRPLRFDSNPTGYVRALPPDHQLSWPRKPTATTGQENTMLPPPEAPKAGRPEKAQKLNVVDKSRLDWTGFVDQEGIGEELDMHGKTKESYLGRMGFLAGVEARREEDRKKMKSAAATAAS